MSRLRLGLFAAVLLAAGCVTVTEPLSDVNKAEPDKGLVGKWAKDTDALSDFVIDVPAVKDNPKGLMRAILKDAKGDESTLWFFCTTIEKKTYANCLVDRSKNGDTPALDKPGEFAKWSKSESRGYIIFHYVLSGDDLAVDGGEEKAVEKQFATQNFEKGTDKYYRTPEGALAKYIATDGAKIFTGEAKTTYKRAK